MKYLIFIYFSVIEVLGFALKVSCCNFENQKLNTYGTINKYVLSVFIVIFSSDIKKQRKIKL